MTNKVYTYFYLSRPPGIGCQPDGFNPDTREIWSPRETRETPTGPRLFWGQVEYPGELLYQQVWKYDLLPADRVEWAKYQIWRESGTVLKVLQGYKDFLASNPENLAELKEDDPVLVECLIIFDEAGIELNNLRT